MVAHRLLTYLKLAAAGGLLSLLTFTTAHAQTQWPSARPITIVVPYAAGSLPDAFLRPIANELGVRLKVPVVVDNVNGAGGVLGTERVATARPDGYTFVLGVESTVLIAPMIRPSVVRYDGLKDLTPISLMGSSPLVLVARSELGIRNLGELLAHVRTRPTSLSYGTSGMGTSLHLAGEMFNQLAKSNIKHIPYTVSTQIMTDVVGNQLDLAMVPVGSALQFIKAGKVKALGVTSATRTPLLPDVPAMAEVPELKGMNMTVWFGLFAPAGVEKSVVETLNGHIACILATDSMRQRVLDLGTQPTVLDPSAFARFLVQERDKFRALIAQRQIRVE